MGAPDPSPPELDGRSWIEGDFEGIYSGDPRGDHRDGGRRFDLQLQSGALRNLRPAPEPTDPVAGDEIYQAELAHMRLPDTADETVLYEVRIRDFTLRHPAEIRGRAYGTVAGRLLARLAPTAVEPEPLPEPPEVEPEPLPEPPEPVEGIAAPIDAPADEGLHEVVEAPDAASWLRRALWLAWLLGTLAFALLCDWRLATMWSLPTAASLAVRQAGHRHGLLYREAGPLGLLLVALQVGMAFGPFAAEWRGDCPGLAPILLAVSAPMILAGGLGAAWPWWITALLWTGVMGTACAAGGGECAASPGAPAAARQAAIGGGATARTDPDGRWPRWPSGMLPRLPEDVMPSGWLQGLPGLGGLFPPADGPADVPDAQTGAPETVVAPPAAGRGDALAEIPSLTAPADMSILRGPGGPPREGSGGWVAPESNAAEGPRLLSVEAVNRDPAIFFASGAGHRVYLQTDPVFESGGSRLRAQGPLELTRLANLLKAAPGRPVLLEVHTDTGGGPREQLARSQRRADAVRHFLVSQGHVSADRFQVRGVGGSHPIVPADGSYAEQAPNRRIEVSLAAAR